MNPSSPFQCCICLRQQTRAIVSTCCHVYCLEDAKKVQRMMEIPGNFLCIICQKPVKMTGIDLVKGKNQVFKRTVLLGRNFQEIMVAVKSAMNFWQKNVQWASELKTKDQLDKFRAEIEKAKSETSEQIGISKNQVGKLEEEKNQLKNFLKISKRENLYLKEKMKEISSTSRKSGLAVREERNFQVPSSKRKKQEFLFKSIKQQTTCDGDSTSNKTPFSYYRSRGGSVLPNGLGAESKISEISRSLFRER